MVFTIRRKLITLAVTAVLFICIACMEAGSVHAAEKNGLVTKASGSIYYYQKGKLLKNAWKTITIKKKKYKYYFGKNGSAYKAPANLFGFYNVKVFKIGKAKYGFDTEGHLVAKGIYVDDSSKIWVFTSSGKYNDKTTKTLRKKFRPFDVTHKVSKDLLKQVRKYFGKPKRSEYSNSCKPWNHTDQFEDLKLIYSHYEVQLVHNKTTGEYALNGFFSC